MFHYRLALLGFGSVGRALAQLLLRKRALLAAEYDLAFTVTGIATGRHGIAIAPEGINLERALELSQSDQPLGLLNSQAEISSIPQFIKACPAEVLFESIPVDYTTGQPAVDYLRLALSAGMHAITANKGPVVHAYRELTDLARSVGRKFRFESAVMDGAPIFSLFRQALPAVQLNGFRGVLNSTTNLILNRMEGGESFDQAVAYAQSTGIAETDPSGDIDGWDAAVKVAGLVTVLMGIPLKPQDVARQGIRDITNDEIECARSVGKRWKLVCSAYRQGEGVITRVAPEMVAPTSPLYAVEGATSIVQFETDMLPRLAIVEGDPSPETTAYGMLADFINL